MRSASGWGQTSHFRPWLASSRRNPSTRFQAPCGTRGHAGEPAEALAEEVARGCGADGRIVPFDEYVSAVLLSASVASATPVISDPFAAQDGTQLYQHAPDIGPINPITQARYTWKGGNTAISSDAGHRRRHGPASPPPRLRSVSAAEPPRADLRARPLCRGSLAAMELRRIATPGAAPLPRSSRQKPAWTTLFGRGLGTRAVVRSYVHLVQPIRTALPAGGAIHGSAGSGPSGVSRQASTYFSAATRNSGGMV